MAMEPSDERVSPRLKITGFVVRNRKAFISSCPYAIWDCLGVALGSISYFNSMVLCLRGYGVSLSFSLQSGVIVSALSAIWEANVIQSTTQTPLVNTDGRCDGCPGRVVAVDTSLRFGWDHLWLECDSHVVNLLFRREEVVQVVYKADGSIALVIFPIRLGFHIFEGKSWRMLFRDRFFTADGGGS
ncbi:hypothetical protein FNV43_RR02222 [Rhamnella rubrinervis]|uniref:Uncharacterized protein n=1 Tax=Rhamnella rubrinervis TaxID=2594499 RepID=A0A8K0MTK1_9ROSA|nr:hypothetical protein FNV43_RR02222 [Rhamnella rubrinervis]